MSDFDLNLGSFSLPSSSRDMPRRVLHRLTTLAVALCLAVILPACDSAGDQPTDDEPPQEGVDISQQAGPGIHDQLA